MAVIISLTLSLCTTGKQNNRVINNTVTGNCSSRQWQNGQEKRTMATYLQAKGYQTFYGGKYLNQVNGDEQVQHETRMTDQISMYRMYHDLFPFVITISYMCQKWRSDYQTATISKYGKEETGGVEHVPVGYNRWGNDHVL